MRVVFMGTPDFAAASLKKLIEEKFNIAAVYTQPDRPKGRGMGAAVSPVKALALSHGLPVYQPERVRTPEAAAEFLSLKAEVLVVVAYGKILPDAFIFTPKHGAVNVHGSLLPKYRGAAPVQRAVLNGDRRTGVTTMYLAPEMDAGDIVYQDGTEIGEFETAGALMARLADMGAELLVKTLRDIDAGIAPRSPQDASGATYAPPLEKDMSPIGWNKTPRMVVRQIVGLQPWPVATMALDGAVLRVFGAEYSDLKTDKAPGLPVFSDRRGLGVACGDGETLYITEVQAPGKKRMAMADYLLGHPVKL